MSEAKGRIKSMSQFMICKSAFDLTQFGGKLINKDEEDYAFFISVVQKHYEEKTYSNIWTIEKIDDYSCEQLDYNAFISSKLFSLLNNLYEICEWMIFWYGNDYDDLDVVHTKNELIDYVRHCIEKPGCELYIQVCKS
ncbi:MAG: hypothetical protein HDR13_14190 [Lachnospiraceae bacterium]|nr:hypothetical protein [Lachnospiraceae bacterium]